MPNPLCMINIAIIEQNRTYRESLKVMLEQIKDFHVVLVSSQDRSLVVYNGAPVQVVLYDASIHPDQWSETTRAALATGIPYKVLLLAMFREELIACNHPDKMLKSAGKSEFESRIKRMIQEQESEFPDVYLKLDGS